MSYIVTFEISTPQPSFQEDKIEYITRTFPQYLCGQQMTKQHFTELVLAEYPMSSVGIISIETSNL